ncbi:MAG: hypothetical protein HQL84_13405 [Magnetococcales bacterium]|nr:hypothetical protein [Magnetococcales bacterium]MBF0151031.1 hypothetical protein [Magnetococcales bacterium]MBF0173723.1 hypothetical protein [Magnetococcales bacterium]MBF0348898.1 hypothetical protein [Magnetococcales bacterium]MBF0632610.1 hypothetical protein [Magnetococcales bacterium]
MGDAIQKQCWKCQTNLGTCSFTRGESCSKCGYSVRVCKNCLHYDPRAYNACREPQSERVVDKEKTNFCDFFKPGQLQKVDKVANVRRDARKAAEALFK